MRCLNSFPDNELIALLQGDDKAAFTEIYERYWLKLYNETHKRVKDEALSADIIQDVFADLWLNRNDRKIDNLCAYLFTAVRYRVFTLYKKEQHLSEFSAPIDFMIASTSDPASIFFEKEILECIRIWLDMQPAKRRQIFVMKFAQDLSTREVSEILNISKKTVHNQFATSLKSLRLHLGKILSLLL